jgi:hypothetical protein
MSSVARINLAGVSKAENIFFASWRCGHVGTTQVILKEPGKTPLLYKWSNCTRRFYPNSGNATKEHSYSA